MEDASAGSIREIGMEEMAGLRPGRPCRQGSSKYKHDWGRAARGSSVDPSLSCLRLLLLLRAMAPYFIRNLVPRREQRAEGRPLLEVLASLTWVQWGHFWSGYV